MRNMSLDASKEDQANAFYENVKQMYNLMLNKKVFPSWQSALEILDRQGIEKLGIHSQLNSSNLNKWQTRYRTLTFYAQKKFNLMREEIEGFSKLIIELNQENIDDSTVEQVIENIQKLVGYFQLDPNRLLDLILSSF